MVLSALTFLGGPEGLGLIRDARIRELIKDLTRTENSWVGQAAILIEL